jgi:hypothetical protein
MRPGIFPSMHMGSELRTLEGRAEVLLAPGVFLRLGENSAVRLLSDEIMDTRVDFLGGSAIIETADMAKEQALTLTMDGAIFGLLNRGLYRLDSNPPQISVYDGEACVTAGGRAQLLKRGRRLRLDGVAVAEKFDTRNGDDFFMWAWRRAEYLAAANASAAASAQASGFTGSSGWIWDSFYDTYTFLPASGFYNSFWGCRFYPVYGGGGGRPPRFNPHPPHPPGHPGGPGHPGRPPGFGFTGGNGHLDGSRGSHSSSGPNRGGPGGGSSPVHGGSGHSGGGYSGGGGHSGGGSNGGGYSGGGGGHSGGGGGGGGSSSGGNSSGGRSR